MMTIINLNKLIGLIPNIILFSWDAPGAPEETDTDEEVNTENDGSGETDEDDEEDE